MDEVSYSSSEDEKSANNEDLLRLIRGGSSTQEIENALSKKGVNINYQNSNRDTYLHVAVRKANKEIVELLINKGADATITNKKDKTPLNLIDDQLKKKPDDPNWQSIKKLLELSRPNASGTKSPSDDLAKPSSPKAYRLDISSTDSSQIQAGPSGTRPKRSLDDKANASLSSLNKKLRTDPTYDKSGLSRSLHGTIYQLQLLMLFVKRAKDQGYDFRLATEMDAAEKFDDVVFKYKDSAQTETYTWSFLQAKHKQDPENNKITVNDLTTATEGDFSLQKYFVSFFKIKQEKKIFQTDDRFEDFTICTNTSFDFKQNLKRKQGDNLTKKDQEHNERIKKWEGFFKEGNDLSRDKILYFNKEAGKEFRFKNDAKSDVAKEIKSALEKNIKEGETKSWDFKGALKKSGLIQDSIREELKKALERGLAISGNSLVGKVLKAEVMLENFGEEESEGQASSIDKARLMQAVGKVLEITKDKDLENKKNKLESKKTKTNKPANWSREEKEALLNKAKDALKRTVEAKKAIGVTEWLKSDEATSETGGDKLSDLKAAHENFDKYIKEFLEKFRFVTNYPSEDKLGDLIKHELGEEFELLNADLVTHSFQKDILDWFKEKAGRFLEMKDTEGFFEEIKGKLTTLMTSGLSKAYPEKLKGYGISFRENLEGLQGFLESSNSKQVFHLVTGITRLSAIRVLGSLEGFDKYKNHDSYIFMRLRTLLRKKTQSLLMKSFHKQGTHDLLVIECQDKTQGETMEILQLYLQLSKMLNSNASKNIILIAQDGDTLPRQFEQNHQAKYQKEYDQNGFKDIDEDSQDKILKKEVNFQGKNISLNQLLDKDSARKIIDQASLSRILEEEKIPIGDQKAFSSIGYVKDYYIKRKLHRQRIRSEVLEKKAGSELFFVSGADQKALTNLGAKGEEIHIWAKGQLYDKGIILLPSGGSDQEIFQELGKQSGKNIHWLEYQKGNLLWRASRGELSALSDYIDKYYVPDVKNSLKEEDISKLKTLGQKVVILANDPGVGKSTVLTSIGHKMKEENPALWVVRVNLSDYAFDKKKLQDHDRRKNSKSLEEIVFKEDNINEAIKFISEMTVPGIPDEDPKIQLQRKLFKAGLEKPKDEDGPKPKIVILFDGFDEISPIYKPNTTKLIKALKGSQLTQLWVTTRIHEKADLEKELESPAYILNDLTEAEQRDFLSTFWKWSLKFSKDPYSQKIHEKTSEEIFKHLKEIMDESSDKNLSETISNIIKKYPPEATEQFDFLREAIDENDENGKDKLDFPAYAKLLLDKWKASIGDTEKAFTLVPLNLRMLAEVVFEKKFRLPENLGLLGLYDEFIKVKFDIFYNEKGTLGGGVSGQGVSALYSKSLSRAHQELAIKLFFPEERELPGLGRLDEFDKKELARVGLLTLKGGELEFIHRSFAEYFLSEYLITNVKDKQVQTLLLEDILLKEDYALIRKFFNDQLGKNPLSDIELPTAVKEAIDKTLEENRKYTVLHRAAQEGHPVIVKFLLDKLKDNKYLPQKLALAIDQDGHTALHLAADNGCTALLSWVTENRLGTLKHLALATNDENQTALHLAALRSHTEIVKHLLNSIKGDKDTLKALVLATEATTDNDEGTALHRTAMTGHTDTFKVLLDFVKLLDTDTLKTLVVGTNNEELTPNILHKTAMVGHTDALKALLEFVNEHLDKGTFKELLKPDKIFKNTALHLAAGVRNHTEFVIALLNIVKDDKGALKKLVLAQNNLGQTALHIAAEDGHTEALNALLGSVKDDKGTLKSLVLKTEAGNQTALHKAAGGRNRTETIEALLESVKDDKATFKALVMQSDRREQTALHVAYWNGYKEIVDELLERVKDDKEIYEQLTAIKERLDKVEKERNPLYEAIDKGDYNQVLNILTEVDGVHLKKELMLAIDDLHLPLHIAAEKGHTIIFQTLLDSVKDDKDTLKVLVLAINGRREFLLHLAAQKGHTEIVNTLFNRVKDDTDILKAVVLATDSLDRNSLHHAAERGRTDTLKVLLDFMNEHNGLKNLMGLLIGADNSSGSTPLHSAAERGHTKTVEALLDWVKRNLDPDTLKALLLKTNKWEINALNMAARGRHTKTVEALLKWVESNLEKDKPDIFKAMVSATDSYEQTVLHEVAFWGKKEIFEALLDTVKNNLSKNKEYLIDTTLKDLVEKTDKDGQTILHDAAEEGHSEVVEAFLEWVKKCAEEGILPNTTLKTLVLTANEDKETALHLAVNKGHIETVAVLLTWVNKNLPDTLKKMVLKQNKSDRTALELAIEKGMNKIVNLLKVRYNLIASSLLRSETNIADFSNDQLNVLEQYVRSDDYPKGDKQEIIKKLEEIRSERSENVGIEAAPRVLESVALRLRGASLEELPPRNMV